MDMIGHYSVFHKEFSENLEKIGSLIGFDQIMNKKHTKKGTIESDEHRNK